MFPFVRSVQWSPGPNGATTLSALFGDSDQLIVYHMMMGPQAKDPCSLCSFFIDGIQGGLPHLLPRAAFAVVAKAPFAAMAAGCAAKGWEDVPLFSASESSFGEDFGVSFSAEQQATKDMPYVEEPATGSRRDAWLPRVLVVVCSVLLRWPFARYNYGRQWRWGSEGPGVSVFKRHQGETFHTYSAYSAALGSQSVVLSLLDLTPNGRDEDGGKGNMWWVKHKEAYEPSAKKAKTSGAADGAVVE
jgi:predicted dithiol-disulfide oxidoreductase (DUF899 family)